MTDEQADLLSWRPARRSDPATSHEAARSILHALPFLESKVLTAVTDHGPEGATLDEVIGVTKLEKVTVSPRFRPLESKGLIRRAGTRPGRAGRPQTVWVANGQEA